jgi:hypothetical protein
LNGDEELQPRGALRILVLGNPRIVVMRGVTGRAMPPDVRVHPDSAVMPVVVIIVEVRVQQRRTERRQLQGSD